MRKAIRKRIRRQEDGISLAADVDAVIAVNRGSEQERAAVTARSIERVAERMARARRGRRDDDRTKEER